MSANADPALRHVDRLLRLAESDPQIGALMPRREVTEAAFRPGLPCDRIIAAYLEGYADRPALGERAYGVARGEDSGKLIRAYQKRFETVTYRELHEKVKAVTMAWRKHPLCRVRAGDFVCIMGFASIDFAILDMACAYAKAVAVPLSGSGNREELEQILAHVRPRVMAARTEDLGVCADHAARLGSAHSLIVFGYDHRIDGDVESVRHAEARLREAGVDTRLVFLNDLVELGRREAFSFLPTEEGEDERLGMIMHSSGSTGRPKGACISAKALANTWRGQPDKLPKAAVILQPFNHNMGRNELCETLSSGGTAFFTLKSDMSTLFEDIRLAKPTSLVFFPRILDLIHQHYLIEVARRAKRGESDRAAVEAAVKAEMRSTFLGDRLLSGAVASAPISNKVKEFIIDCFDIHLVDGYSTTETASGGLAIDGMVNREIVLDYRLREVPELGYFPTDTPYPRGEFCVKTRFGIKEYYRQPEATAELFDELGYTRTGDIVVELGPDHIAIIDRKRNILKLPQGEYVALGPLGKLFEGGSALISQIYLHGSSDRPCLLAVVVPDMDVAREMLGSDDVDDGRLKAAIRSELSSIANRERLKRFEVPRDILVEPEPFSRANGLLSVVNKYLIPAFRKKYGPALEAMYRETEQDAAAAAVRAIESLPGVEQKMAALAEMVLGVEIARGDELKPFHALGGDSLAAVLLSMHIEEVFGVTVGGDAILSPTGSIRQWSRIVENSFGPGDAPPSADSIQASATRTIDREDLRLELFRDLAAWANAPSLPPPATPPRTVLLTGANGFVGQTLCLGWLRQLAKAGDRLICLVRAADNEDARKRLGDRFADMDPQYGRGYFRCPVGRLEVVAGDLSQPFLGLDRATFQRLAEEVDHVCHAGALVNHRLGFRHLFGPNVGGTAELIRLALSRKRKSMDFLSTVGVNDLLEPFGADQERAALKPRIQLSDDYASGYIASKWAGEQLLVMAHASAGLAANIFRCDFILPDLGARGRINANDVLTRLFYSIAVSGVAPETFYESRTDSAPAQASFGGIPADVLSDAIIGASISGVEGLNVYNACNYYQEDLTLDTFVAWVQSAGYPVDASYGYAEWLERIEQRLGALPPAQMKKSIAVIPDAFKPGSFGGTRIPDCSRFKALVRSLHQGHDPHPLTERHFHGWLRTMRATLMQA